MTLNMFKVNIVQLWCFFARKHHSAQSPIRKCVVVKERKVYIEPCEQRLWDEEHQILPLLEVTVWVFVPLLDLRFSTGERWHTPAAVYPPGQVIHTGLSIEPAPKEYNQVRWWDIVSRQASGPDRVADGKNWEAWPQWLGQYSKTVLTLKASFCWKGLCFS